MKSILTLLMFLVVFAHDAALSAESEISFENYDSSFKNRVLQIQEAEVVRNREILAAYRPRVQKVLEQATREGNLEAAQSAKSELERIDEETLTLENVEENIVPSLESLAPILKKQLSDSRVQRTKEERNVMETYIEALGRLQKALVQKGEVDGAVAAKNEAERLERVLAKADLGSVSIEFPAALDTGLVLRYTFEDVADGEVSNTKSSSLSGTVTGATAVDDPEFGACLQFNGDSDRLAINGELPDTDRFTLSAWIKLDNLDESAGVFSDYTSAPANDTFFAVQPKSGVFVRADKDGSNLQGSIPFAKPWRGGWNHLVWVMDKSSSRIFLNGELSGELEQEGSNKGHHEAFIGHAHGGRGYVGMRGKMDEVCFWRRSLSESEVKSLFQYRP